MTLISNSRVLVKSRVLLYYFSLVHTFVSTLSKEAFKTYWNSNVNIFVSPWLAKSSFHRSILFFFCIKLSHFFVTSFCYHRSLFTRTMSSEGHRQTTERVPYSRSRRRHKLHCLSIWIWKEKNLLNRIQYTTNCRATRGLFLFSFTDQVSQVPL